MKKFFLQKVHILMMLTDDLFYNTMKFNVVILYFDERTNHLFPTINFSCARECPLVSSSLAM
jgi:hypothetical protein